jgi:hypothetical protein
MLQSKLLASTTFKEYTNAIEKQHSLMTDFRDGFWISTTSRFFYIGVLMSELRLTNVFHIENDIIMYKSFRSIFEENKQHKGAIWMVQDSPHRVVPSLLFFPNATAVDSLTTFIASEFTKSPHFINDMDILGRYQPKHALNILPDKGNVVYDGAAIGQYLGGVDDRNIPSNQDAKRPFRNPLIGFVNETSAFKPDTCTFSKANVSKEHLVTPVKCVIGVSNTTKKTFTVSNVHVHSKQLYRFSSVFDFEYDDIISGDRVLSLCDFAIMPREVYNFHKNIHKFAKEIVIVKDWNQVDTVSLNAFFRDFCIKSQTNIVRLFIYTHTLHDFIDNVLEHLDTTMQYVFYMHNSDHSFDATYSSLLEKPFVNHVFAQNIDLPVHPKLTLLPIGIANSMWPHGDTSALYKVMISTYYKTKTKGIYVNINPQTFGFRSTLLQEIKRTQCYDISQPKPYGEYLKELSQHHFCLCVRGNGLDTHRFWESLYLGVIPVVINNKSTSCTNFLAHVKNLKVPYVEITADEVDVIAKKYPKQYFTQALYTRCMLESETPPFANPSLKLGFYKHYAC